jgi:WD40 repeat protein
MINDSPSHIYCSALKFLPSSSWLHQYYSAGLSQEVKVIRGLSAGWGICFRTVLFDMYTGALACGKDTIAVGLEFGGIVTLNAVTGSQIGVLSGHTDWVASLTFSQDGISLVSGSHDKTVKLWDMQTGGVIKTFQGHTNWVLSVSISPDCTTIASGSTDKTIHLWDIQTGECHCIIQQEGYVMSVNFSTLDPQHFMSISDGKVWEWNIDGHKLGPEYDGGTYAAFYLDGTKFVLCNRQVVQVRSSDSRAVVAEFHLESDAESDGESDAESDIRCRIRWGIRCRIR